MLSLDLFYYLTREGRRSGAGLKGEKLMLITEWDDSQEAVTVGLIPNPAATYGDIGILYPDGVCHQVTMRYAASVLTPLD